MINVKEHQQPLDIDGQIENLENINLIINDKEYAKQILNDVSYFRLIKAYGLGLKEKNKKFPESITFEHIVELYLFNCNFRQLLFPAIERIEINLRCRVSNYFSSTYGSLGYEDPKNFQNAVYHTEFIKDIDEEIKRNSRAPFVRNFRENYTNQKIPFYALIELFSFGTLSKFFKNLKNCDKKIIAKSFGIGYTYLESWIESLAFVRNICAHYGRIYNAKLVKTPILYNQYNSIKNNRIFGILICMKHLLNSTPKAWDELLNGLVSLINKYNYINLKCMGFPDNWVELLGNPKLEYEKSENSVVT